MPAAGFELDRNAPERRSGSFLNRNGVPVHFFENSERKSDSFCCVYASVLPSAQNAQKTLFRGLKSKKKFWGGPGKAPPPTAPPVRRGHHFIPH